MDKNRDSLVFTRILFYCLAFITPLALTPYNYELFEFNKMLLVYVFTALITVSIGTSAVRTKKLLIPTTPLDIPIFLFLFSQLASTFLSIDPHVSLYGYYGRFNGGLLSTICYIILYYSFIIAFHERLSNIVKNVSFNPKDFFQIFRIGKNNEDVLPLPIQIESNPLSLKRLTYGAFGSAFLVAIYAFAQKFGIDEHLWVQDVQNRVFSTLGQPNWLAAYLIPFIFISIGLVVLNPSLHLFFSKIAASVSGGILGTILLNQMLNLSFSHNLFITVSLFLSVVIFSLVQLTKIKKISSIFFILLTLIFYTGLLFTKSRSGLLSFWISNAMFVFILFYVKDIISTRKRLLFLPFYTKEERSPNMNNLIILNTILVFFTFIISTPFKIPWINTFPAKINPSENSTALEDVSFNTNVTDSGDIRKIVWAGAWNAALARPYFGWGTETFAWVYYRFKPVEHNLTSEWDFLYNKAHNEYLNYAATTGFVGLTSYLLILLVFLWWWVQNLFRKTMNDKKILMIAVGIGWISLLITNFFGFSVVVTSLLFWLLPAALFLLAKSASISTFALRLSSIWTNVLVTAIYIVGLYVIFSIGTYWLSDYYYAKGISSAAQDKYQESYSMLSNAVALRPGEPVYLNELSETLSILAYSYDEQNDATISAELTEQSILATNKALSISPFNTSFWKGRTRVFYNLSQINPIYSEQALQSIETAQVLAPTDPKVAYNRAILLNNANEKEKAIEALEQALKMKPNYRDAAWALAIFYEEDKNIEKRNEWLNYILENINPDDSEVKEKLKN